MATANEQLGGEPLGMITTPWWPATTALALAGLSVVIALFANSLTLECVGYAIGGLLAPSFVAVHRSIDSRRSSAVNHVGVRSTSRVAVAAVVLTLIGATFNAWLVATELAKR